MDDLIERITKRIQAKCERYGLDGDGLVRYVVDGYQPGGFLTAVLQDQLVEAANHADSFNGPKLYEWASVMYNDVPIAARGSRENVSKWLSHRGLRGLAAESQS